MTTPGTGPREGKSCPRCRTMTYRDREVCEHCGHRFRTGLGTGLEATPVDAVLTDEASLNRTMQFTLPPLAPRPAPGAAPAMPAPPMPAPPMPPRLSRGRLASAALAVIALGAGCFLYARIAHTAKPSPAGVWETAAATGRAPQEGRLRMAFQPGGGGSFSWEPGGSAPPVSAPLRWRLDADGRLLLSIAPASPGADPVPGALITVLDSRPWVWQVDRPKHLLIIGPLNLMEKA